MTSIVVLGGSFAGINAAFELELELGKLRRSPSWRATRASCFSLTGLGSAGMAQAWADQHGTRAGAVRRGIKFLHATAERIDPDQNTVFTDQGDLHYDYLLIATGARHDWSVVPGLGPITGNTHSICNIAHAMEPPKPGSTSSQDPGPVVIGSAQGASCFGAAYEMVFNIDRALRQAKIRDRAPLAFVTAEPFLGHFGLGGMRGAEPMLKAYFKLLGITPFVNVGMTAASKGSMHSHEWP